MKTYIQDRVWSLTTLLYVFAVKLTGTDPNPIGPLLPGGPPEGSDGVTNGFKYIIAWALLIGIGMGVLFTAVALIKAAWKSDRYKISDAKTPLIVALIFSAFGAVLQAVWGVFNGVVSSFSG